MEFDQWPIVVRRQLVQAFKPGEPTSREAPFRTLRAHGWSTAGVSIVTRREHRASGRLTIFSVLNLDAARFARLGDRRRAKAHASAAARIEASADFLRLKELLTGRPVEDVTAVVEGAVPAAQSREIHEQLRRVARATLRVRPRGDASKVGTEVVVGRISETMVESITLTALSGERVAIPRWLARTAGREGVGECLALVSERFDDGLVTHAFPAIALEEQRAQPEFSPFGRAAPVTKLTPSDVRVVAGAAGPLKVLVPVTIER